MYVYIKSEQWGLWTVGFYSPNGKWFPESDWDEREKAAERVSYLNGNGFRKDPFPDTEADGYVFCGKCGKMK